MTKFTNDWFERDAQKQFESCVLPHARWIKSYLEIGVCEGASMLWILEHLQPELAIGVDWWKSPRRDERRQKVYRDYEAAAIRNLQPYLDSGQVRLHKMSSRSFMGPCEQSFDLIYCDGDHSGNGAMRDFLLAYELLTSPNQQERFMILDGKRRRVGGILVVDDLNRLANRGMLEVKPAWDLFLTLMHGRVRLLWEHARQAACIRIG